MPTASPIRVAVITGVHPYHVPEFQSIFRGFGGMDCYPQNLEDFSTSPDDVRAWYDALVFYNMHMAPLGEGGWEPAARHALEQLGETPQGLVILHHAILAWPEWSLWSEIVGIADRSFSYHYGETVNVEIADPAHPITAGLSDWTMTDETYLMASCDAASHVLLTTEHPRSMRTLAWTRPYRQSRVVNFESGHDGQTYADPNFQAVLANSIRWSAGRL